MQRLLVVRESVVTYQLEKMLRKVQVFSSFYLLCSNDSLGYHLQEGEQRTINYA